MKKLRPVICIVLILSALLSGCGRQTVKADPKTLPFPGTEWGMTPEEVCAALQLPEGSYERHSSEREDGSPSLFLTDVYLDVFGANARVGFSFSDNNADGRFSLVKIDVVYPQDTDMQAVLSAMKEAYGAPAVQMGSTRADWSSAVLCRDYMTDQDREFLSGQDASGEEAMQAPLTAIQLMTYFPFQASYQGDASTNVVTFRSSYGFYVKEGGYTGYLPA